MTIRVCRGSQPRVGYLASAVAFVMWGLLLAPMSGQTTTKASGLRLAIDDSASMAGYAEGNGCFDQLWTDDFDAQRAESKLGDFESLLVGATLRPGPALGNLTLFAGGARYRQPRTEIVQFLHQVAAGKAFKNAGDSSIVAFVSDMQPDANTPESGCGANSSVTCLANALSSLAEKGFHIRMVAFRTPFTGKRFYPSVSTAGVVNSDAFTVLNGSIAPVYVVLISKDTAQLDNFSKGMTRRLSARCGAGEVKTLNVTSIERPRLSFLLSGQPLAEIKNVLGKVVAVRRQSFVDGKSMTYRIYNSSQPVRLSIPLLFALPGSTYDETERAVKWTLTHTSDVTPSALKSSVAIALTDSGQNGVVTRNAAINISVPREALESKTPLNVTLRVVAMPEQQTDLLSAWSFRMSAESGFGSKSYRISEILSAVFGRTINGNRAAPVTTECVLQIQR